MSDSKRFHTEDVQKKYDQERAKRLRGDGISQFVEMAKLDKYSKALQDIWIDPNAAPTATPALSDGSRCEVLILGAGYGGLLAAIRLMEAGVNVDDIRFVDWAGGFGGSWWLNRYPGLMCDIESYIYLPLLEETGYMPKHKYSYGPEIRSHADNIARKYGLHDKALFEVTVLDMSLDEKTNEWTTTLQSRAVHNRNEIITIRSRFSILCTGTLNFPKVPKIPGLENFKGHSFHTAYWDYKCTGGSELSPELSELKDKRVGIIGTGATAIQVVPELAKWSKELYVFQRTPSAVDERGQRETDPEWWKTNHTERPGWQNRRRVNFRKFTSNEPDLPSVDLVQDGWTKFPTYSAHIGGPKAPLNEEEIPDYIGSLHDMDLLRQDKVRARVDQIIQDKATAEKLKAWYPGWCKRPCFHDDYLQSFNKDHVKLIDTNGKGIDALTQDSVVFDGQEFPLDVLIFSTGYEISLTASPAGRCHMTVHGRGGRSLEEKWNSGVATLHGLQSNEFPNLFWLGLTQTALTSNQIWIIEELASHLAYIFSRSNEIAQTLTTRKPTSRDKYPFTIETTVEGEEDWTRKIMDRAGAFQGTSACPPSYFNEEGAILRAAETGPEAQKKLSRAATWGTGFKDYLNTLKGWREDNTLAGIKITPA